MHRGGELCTFVNGFVRPVPEGGDFVGVTLLGSPSKQGCCHEGEKEEGAALRDLVVPTEMKPN